MGKIRNLRTEGEEDREEEAEPEGEITDGEEDREEQVDSNDEALR